MNDRFRFRAWVVGQYFSKNDEEKEILVKINDVIVYDDGTIGIDYYSLLKSVCSFLKDEGERDSLIEYFEDKNCTTGDDWYYLEAKFIEQCTGLKDKNGRLIYENDYVKIGYEIFRVFWNSTKISLENMLKNDIIDVQKNYIMEIIGNAHEKRDIREVQKNS